MAYATLQDLIDRFGEGELAQVADTLGSDEIDPTVVDRALLDAAAEIDAALVGRYALPMASVPVLLTRIACDLARESLYSAQPTKTVADRAAAARALLLSIAKGTMRLEAPKAEAAETVQGLVEMVSGRRRSPFGG